MCLHQAKRICEMCNLLYLKLTDTERLIGFWEKKQKHVMTQF